MVVFAFIFLGKQASSQQDGAFTFTPKWSPGDERQYILETEKIKWIEDSIVTTLSLKKFITIHFDFENRQRVVHWTYDSMHVDNAHLNPAAEALLRLNEGFEIIYTVDESGGFEQLINWTEIADKRITKLNTLFEAYPQYSERKSELMMAIGADNKDQKSVENSIRKDIDLFHMPFGLAFIPNDTVSHDIMLDNPINNRGFPAVIQHVVMEQTADSATLLMTQTTDKEGTKEVMREMLAAYVQNQCDSLTDDMLPTFDIQDTNQFRVSLTTGWIEYASFKRFSNVAGARSEDSYFFKLIENE